MKKTKPSKKYPLIEKKTFKDRVEFRIKVKRKYPKFVEKNKNYVEYLSRMVQYGNVGSFEPYVWIAHKPNFIERFCGFTFNYNVGFQETKCRNFLNKYLQEKSLPKIEEFR
ncbi:hypothetical protein LCGC14_2434870 [marine sediment metagenome]|uniref:Uncharacterized protein n=1 Tax=marine sediment metagenome TaxID=412755 RepID=A0A0F9BKY2_9ZZZZ